MAHRIQLFIVSVMLAFSSIAAASPAQDLFDQAAYLLIVNYGGFSSASPKALEVQFQLELDKACAGQVETCPYMAAHPVITRMLEALKDGHSTFLPAESLQGLNNVLRSTTTSGKSTGLISIPAKDATSRLVLDVYPQSPAARAGLRRGDRIVMVNAQVLSSFGDQIDAVLAFGQNDQAIQVMVVRAGQTINVTLEPEELPAMPNPNLVVRPDRLAVLRIPTFLVRNLGEQVEALLREAKAQNARALILDLRDNGGGLVSEYVRVAGAFLDDPGRRFDSVNPLLKFSLQFRDAQVSRGNLEVAKVNPNRWSGPVVVLVNADSASAAEFTAHDLQLYAKATVIGVTTFGVGNTMTRTFTLEDGSGLLITLAKALHPDGSPYPERIVPDIAVTDDLEAINQTGRDVVLERALEVLSR
jgi:carboxyl-terminal processing protease